MKMIMSERSIVVSGDLGSGKSTVSRELAERLGLRRISMGDLYREMAQSRGMSALQINLHAERDEALDDRVDQFQAQLARSGEPLVVDSRLAWFFFSQAFKVHLIVDPAVAARRAMSRPASNVEAYASLAEAVGDLQRRSASERSRFLRKYGVDKMRLRNYDMVCDSTRASQTEISEDIIAAYSGTFGKDVLSQGGPLLLLDPARIYPGQAVSAPPDLEDSGQAAGTGPGARHSLEPISVAYTGRYFYVVDGHRRLSAALRSGFTLVAARLQAEAEEEVVPGLSAREYFETGTGLTAISDWEAAHAIDLPLPAHLAAPVRST